MNVANKKTSPAEARIRRLGAYIAAAFFGGLFGLSITFIVVSVRGRGLLPEITAQDFQDARQKWIDADVTDYELTVVVRSRELAIYRVTVRDGAVEAAYRNDQQLRQERTMGTWSVPGMFETIELDVKSLELHRLGKAEPGTPQLALRAKFDQQFGYPTRYQRTEMRKFGSNLEISWEVTDFKTLP